ncbi:MAG: ribose-5-phosphate isomerase A [Aliidongia sp.]
MRLRCDHRCARARGALKQITGVVESGLFIGLATEVIVAGAGGVEVVRRA